LIDLNLKFNLLVKIVPIKFKLSKLDLITLILSLPISVYYIFTRHWLLNNFFGILFSVYGIQTLNLPSFKIAFILLWGLFFYDIFWVYGTDVMVTVAKSIDAPIKLLFPIDLTVTPPKFSILGLGDIVIPGIFIALCNRYDINRVLAK
jgi:minor histocompatibility antigen H13